MKETRKGKVSMSMAEVRKKKPDMGEGAKGVVNRKMSHGCGIGSPSPRPTVVSDTSSPSWHGVSEGWRTKRLGILIASINHELGKWRGCVYFVKTRKMKSSERGMI